MMYLMVNFKVVNELSVCCNLFLENMNNGQQLVLQRCCSTEACLLISCV